MAAPFNAPLIGSTAAGKVLLVGDTGVGKSTLAHKLAHGEFRAAVPTVGCDFVSLRREQEHIRMWDLSGNAANQGYARMYAGDCQCVVLVYDMSNAASFTRLYEWFHTYLFPNRDLMHPECAALLVGNKRDLGEACELHREVLTLMETLESCFSGVKNLEVSAKLDTQDTLLQMLPAALEASDTGETQYSDTEDVYDSCQLQRLCVVS